MLRNFAWAVFVGFFLVSTAFVVPISSAGAGHKVESVNANA